MLCEVSNFAIIMLFSVCDKAMPHRGRLIIEKAVIVKRLRRSHLKMEIPVLSEGGSFGACVMINNVAVL
jgi:hypothetical protein